MINYLLQAILVNAFFFSFALIGWATIKEARRFKYGKPLNVLFDQPIFTRLLFFIMTGFLVFGIPVMLAFFLGAKAIVLVIAYLALILFALWRFGQNISKTKELPLARIKTALKGQPRLLLLILVMIVIVDAGISLKVGSTLVDGNDAYVHMSKITQWSEDGMTNSDAFFGNGVIESRYQVNVVYGAYATATSLFGLETYTTWRASLPFFRFVEWLAIFALVSQFIPKAYRRRQTLTYAVAIAAPIFLGLTFAYANYPNGLVLAWFCAFIIGLQCGDW